MNKYLFIQLLSFQTYLFIQLFKKFSCQYPNITVKSIQPIKIKIIDDSFEYLTLIFNTDFNESILDFNITFENCKNTSETIILHAAEEEKQDKYKKNKIVFTLNQKLFLNKNVSYGRYKISNMNDNINLTYDSTILIYLNDISLKNPIIRYELTGKNEEVIAKYDLKDEILIDYINKIKDEEQKEINYYITEDKKSLLIKVNRTEKAKEKTFYIIPEYDKNISPDEALKVYLCFHDYILKNDAIYIRKETDNNDVTLEVQFSNINLIKNLSITDDSGVNYNSNNNRLDNICDNSVNCIYNIVIGSKSNPGKLWIEYSPNDSNLPQKRSIFLILYESDLNKCIKNDKDIDIELSLKLYWTLDMEYNHELFFNNSARKRLDKYERETSAYSKAYKYSLYSSSLNTGIFSIYSLISQLSNYNTSTYINPVNNKSLYITIYPGSDLEEEKNSVLFIYNDTEQIDNFTTNYGIGFLDEIILKKTNNEFTVSKTNGQCKSIINDTIFTCNFTDVINNSGPVAIGDYDIFYKSKCDNQLYRINKRTITIKQGSHLISISPEWTTHDEVNKTKIILEYDTNMNVDKLNINIIKNESYSKSYSPNSKEINNKYVTIIFDELDIGIYNIETSINDNKPFKNDTLKFRVISKLTKFSFNHYYFALNNNNDNDKNYLIITVNDNSNTFACMIEENNKKQILDDKNKNCKKFYYKINRTGNIKFNYYNNETDINITIPIVQTINVYSSYEDFFYFPSFKICYYYIFDIILKFIEDTIPYNIFLYNYTDNQIIPLSNNQNESSNIHYTYNENNISSDELINNEYYLIISENSTDEEVYLYKSNLIKFTDIKVPKFIINPYKTITFSNVSCNLNESNIYIKKSENIEIQISDCRYYSNNSSLLCEIKYNSFYYNNPYINYSYLVDNKKVININEPNSTSLTFASNKISDSSFQITFSSDKERNITIYINNTSLDFYYPLYYEIGYYKIKNEKYEDKLYNITNFIKYNKDGIIEFNLELGNYGYDINYIKREKLNWEEKEDDSMIHYFNYNENHIFNNHLYNIEPTFFIYHDLDKYVPKRTRFSLNIIFNDPDIKNSYENQFKYINCSNYSTLIYECYIETNDSFNKNPPKDFTIFIGDEPVQIDFIYYSLVDNSTKCKTKDNNIGNFYLYINLSNSFYIDLIELLPKSSMNFYGPEIDNNILTYTLIGKELNLKETKFSISVLGYPDFEETFTLKQLGINVHPAYVIKLENNENTISFLPGEGYLLLYAKVNIKEEVDNNTDIQIKGFSINENIINGKNFTINSNNSITIKFDLKEDYIDYNLYYIDYCDQPIITNITISVKHFIVKRNYFVLNNNNYKSKQTLIFDGPYNDISKIEVFKDHQYLSSYYNGTNYNLDLYQNSNGNYTFKFSNKNEYESPKVYVLNNLNELFDYDEVPSCIFLYNESFLENISYTISIKNELGNNISCFNSYIRINGENQKLYINDTNDDKNRTFILNRDVLNGYEIVLNQEYHIYLVENDDIDQPLYIFKIIFTNITLDLQFSEFIYTDAKYISFYMYCEIDDMDNFYLTKDNKNEKYILKCQNNSEYINKNYKCYLSEDEKINSLLLFGKTINEYKNYSISYKDPIYKINEKPFIISHDISTADFILIPNKYIYIDQNTTFQIKTREKYFYFNNTIEKVTYFKSFSNYISDDNNLNFSFNNDYINGTIYIEYNYNYTIKTICRKNCIYCRNNNNCWNLDSTVNNFTIYSNTPKLNFTFDRKYFAINNSSYSNNNTILNILVNGLDIERLDSLNYKIDGDPIENKLEKKGTNSFYLASPINPGKYEFSYKVENDNESYDILLNGKKVIFLVVEYDYEIFIYSELNKRCLYSDGSSIYASITKNWTYDFYDDVDSKDILIELTNDQNNTIYFSFNENKFTNNNNYKINFNTNYTLKLIEKDSIKYRHIFTTINHEFQFTSFSINESIPFFYKDNIVLINQFCKLDNIYIRQDNYKEDDKYYNLDCNYIKLYNKSYCDAKNYMFVKDKSHQFQFFIGNNKYILNLISLIYNSIKDSDFTFNYFHNIINITSNNFDMNCINYILIDEKQIDSFDGQTQDFIYFNFIKSNDSLSKNIIKELVRNDHYEDYEEAPINTIKNKILNYIIVETKCSDNKVFYNGKCIYCYELSYYVPEYANRIWSQDGECVTLCNFTKYKISSRLYYTCSICKYIDGNDKNLCGCPVGAVKSYRNDYCYLPENQEIKNLINDKSNVQCYLEDRHNYCDSSQNNTYYCNTYGYSGHLFPQCICNKGFEGKYCEFKNKLIDLNAKMEIILSDKEIIDEHNIEIISNIRGIIYYLEVNGKEYIQKINDNYINEYINSSMNILEKIINGEKENNTYPQIYDVFELAIFFLKYKYINKNNRNLEEDSVNLNKILRYMHLINYYANKNTFQEYNIQANKLNLTSFIVYRKNIINSEDFKIEMANTSLFKIIEYIDIYTEKNNDILIFVTLINNSLFNNSDDNDFGVRAYFSTINSIKNDDLRNLKNITFYISSKEIKFNYDLAQYYKERKIDIYNKADLAFKEPCYLSKEFDFDLTQKYRKNNIFQKVYYGSEVCNYTFFESKFRRIVFNCTKFNKIEKIQNLYYGLFFFNIKKDVIENANKVYNLPIKCVKKIDKLENNIAFWLFLIICFFEILYIIGINILTLGSLKKISFRKGLINDELYFHIPRNINEEDEKDNSKIEQLPKQIFKDYLKASNFQLGLKKQYDNRLEDKFYKNLLDCIIDNFKELHPIATLCRVSLISPLILHSWFFVFNILCLFGFNALLYYESLIEKRIFDKKRNYFNYPMRKEFHKILLSILCQAAITALIKLLLIVSLSKRNNLKLSLSKCSLKNNEDINNEIVIRIEQFQNEMLLNRLIGGIIMFICIIFFFFYSVSFCGIYIQTQKNWIFSCIWSLFWNWVIFSPIYIVVISIIELKKENSYDPLVYNLKRLFFF